MDFSKSKLKFWILAVLLAISGMEVSAQNNRQQHHTNHGQRCQTPLQINSMSLLMTRVENNKVFYTLNIEVANLKANSEAFITVTVDDDLQQESKVSHNGFFDFEISAPAVLGNDFYVACQLYNRRGRLVDEDGCIVVIEGF